MSASANSLPSSGAVPAADGDRDSKSANAANGADARTTDGDADLSQYAELLESIRVNPKNFATATPE